MKQVRRGAGLVELCVFPGEIAGASLKRRLRPRPERRRPDRFPRRNRRGLIEAGPRRWGAARWRAVFPGEIAGASLKRPVLTPRPERGREVFPGEIAGASLKPVVAESKSACHFWFSPAKSPGPH